MKEYEECIQVLNFWQCKNMHAMLRSSVSRQREILFTWNVFL